MAPAADDPSATAFATTTTTSACAAAFATPTAIKATPWAGLRQVQRKRHRNLHVGARTAADATTSAPEAAPLAASARVRGLLLHAGVVVGVQVRILRRLPWLPRVFHPAALAAAFTLAATLAALALAAAVAAALATRPTAALAAALRPAATPHRAAVTLAPVPGQRHRGDRPPRGRDPRHEPSARDHTRSRAARGRGSCRYRGVASHAARGEAHAVPGGCARRPHTARDAPPL